MQKYANRKGLEFLEEINNKSNIKSQGVILNGIKISKWRRFSKYSLWIWLWIWLWLRLWIWIWL